MSQRSIEVKVGFLILVALGLLAGFVVVMGGLSLQPTFTVYVSFQNPGGLQSGAPIRIAGVKVGHVSELEFRGGMIDPLTKQPEPTIRAVAKIERRYKTAIHDNSRWFVTSQGVLGEMFLAIEPGSSDRPLLNDEATVTGISPPRLDLLLSESYELLHKAYLGITNNEQKISETFDGLHRTLHASGQFFEHNQGKLDHIVDNVDSLSATASDTLKGVREHYVDNPQIARIFNNIERTTTTLNQNLEPILSDGRATLADAKKLTHALASEDQVQRYQRITSNLSDATAQAKVIGNDAQALLERVKSGKGTVGALIMDDALYDDLQEMLRDLKHNPWKFFWKQ
ncbi:MAG TPA: MlaD family protein [Polyangiaceae bacterium]|nr:MlaD family protein [Polyangiaceae bacterium]